MTLEASVPAAPPFVLPLGWCNEAWRQEAAGLDLLLIWFMGFGTGLPGPQLCTVGLTVQPLPK